MRGAPDKISIITELGFKSVDELLRKKAAELEKLPVKTETILNKKSKDAKMREIGGKGPVGIYGNQKISQKNIEKASKLLKQYVRKGSRQDFALYIAGYLIKLGVGKELVENILRRIFKEDIEERINTVETTINKTPGLIRGWEGIFDIIYRHLKNKKGTLLEMEKLENYLIPPGGEYRGKK